MSWYTASNSTNQIAEQLIYGEWLYYKYIYIPSKQTSSSVLGWLYDVTDNFSQVLYAVSVGAVTAGVFILAGALWTPEPDLYKQMLPKSVIETSKLNKCSLVVFERETVI
jgi:hypothetical protein